VARSEAVQLWLMRSPRVMKFAGLLNRLLISKLGLRVTFARRGELYKEWFDKLLYFYRLFQLLEDVEGDVVECGVASGRSLAIITSLLRSSRISRHIWGFDNWSGLPEPSKEDLGSTGSLATKGKFVASSKEMVTATLKWHGFEDSEIESGITLVKGPFCDTLPKFRGTHIALLHVDADLYESYRDSLRCLWTKVSVGGIATFDEYQAPVQWPGARKAVDEFFGNLPQGSARLCQDTLYPRYYAVKTA